DPLFAKRASRFQNERDVIMKEGERRHAMWESVPENERMDFLKAMDTDGPVKPEFEQNKKVYQKQLFEAYLNEKEYGSKADYIENYMPRVFERDQPGLKEFMTQRIESLGPNWFQKARHFDLLQEALDAGYKLKTTNPEELVRARLMSGADMRTKVELLRSLDDMGMASKVKDGDPAGNKAMLRQGWEAVNAPNGEQYLLSPEIQPLWQNAISAADLWTDRGLKGDAFRGWMNFKAATVPFKLTLSAF